MQSMMGSFSRVVAGVGLASMLLLFACVAARAQDGPRESTPMDKLTPPALAPGAPAGSYALSGFDNVNLFNGNLNFTLPLVHIGGRGEAGYTIALALNSKGWNVRRTANHSHNEDVDVFFTPWLKTWNPLDIGYSSGVLILRHGGEGNLNSSPGGIPQPLCHSLDPLYEYTYTRLTFAMADGTEIDFRDQLTGGQPQAVPFSACNAPGAPGFDRGQVFITFDGTAATFISDSHINDKNISNGNTVGDFNVSGYLFLANGMRYRIDSGQVSSIQDRNGNQVTFSGPATRPTTPGVYSTFTVTDPLGRVTRVEYNVTDSSYGLGDRITYPGFNSTSRVLFITRGSLADALRADQTLKNYTDLFPTSQGLNGSQNYLPNIFNPLLMASAVYLPDGRRYRFFYNSYAELARVELPTGGAYEYDMVPGSGVVSNPAGSCSEDPEYEIYRRVAERRTLPDGNTVEGRTTYTENAAAGTVTVDHLDPSQGNQLLTREIHYFNGNAVNELFDPRPAFTFWDEGKEFRTDIQDGSGKLLRQTTTNLQQAGAVSWFTNWLNSPIKGTTCYNYGSEPANNPRNLETDTTLADVTPNLTSKETFAYDQFNNVTEKDEFDYGATSATRTTVNTYLTKQTIGGVEVNYVKPNVTSPTSTIHLRRLVSSTTVNGVVGSTLTPQAVTNYNYDEDGSAISDDPGIVEHDTSFGTGYQPRGNTTSVTRYTNASALSVAITSKSTYDTAGNVTSATDPLGNTSRTTYDSSHGAFAFVATVTSPAPDTNHTGHGSSASLQTSSVYDFSTGAPVTRIDVNGQATNLAYNDVIDRPTGVSDADGASVSVNYGDAIGDLFSHVVRSLDGSNSTELYDYLDGFGRHIRSVSFDGTQGTPWVAVDTYYDAEGRRAVVSNPYRVSTPSSARVPCSTTIPCTTTTYDALGRVTAVATPDGAIASTTFSGNNTTITDQALRTRTMTADALGRLEQVTENPTNLNSEGSPVTTYSYNVLNELVAVVQGGQHRYFTYDSLGHLLRRYNPEEGINTSLPTLTDFLTGNNQWSVGFSYDANGNNTSKTDAHGVTVSYTYDALDRETNISYQNDPTNTPSIDKFYDGKGTAAHYALGRLTAAQSSDPSSGSYTFDDFTAGGRLLGTTQTVDGVAYPMRYRYNLGGFLTTEIYPSNRAVTTELDGAGRIRSITSSNDSGPYASSIQYVPHGGIASLQLGNGLWEHTFYDPNRLQVTETGVATTPCVTPPCASDVAQFRYDYGTTNNNGNVLRAVINVPTSQPGTNMLVTQLAQYDGFNRLLAAQEVSGDVSSWQSTAIWQQNFSYDRFGNRTGISVTGGGLLTAVAPQIDPVTNRIDVTQAGGYAYDRTGNLTQEPTGSGHVYTYNGDSQLITAQEGASVQNFKYDGLGHRVKKISGTVATVYVYDASDHLIAEYSTDAPTNNGTRYVSQDGLGSERLVTDSNAAVVARYDLLPFGELIPSGLGLRNTVPGYASTGVIRQLFTGKERDTESGLDFFGARYYSSNTGRWLSPDWSSHPETVPHAALDNPQSLNLYGYVRANPLSVTDPDGHDSWGFSSGLINALTSNEMLGAGRTVGGDKSHKAGQAVGDFISVLSGISQMVFGAGGEVLGITLDATGVGAFLGVPANAVSALVVAHGASTTIEGGGHLVLGAVGADLVTFEGQKGLIIHNKDGSDIIVQADAKGNLIGTQVVEKPIMGPKEGSSGGPGEGKAFGDKTKAEGLAENQAANGGDAQCVFCGDKVGPGTDNKINYDHADPKSQGGNNTLENLNVTCEYCNKSKGTGTEPKNPKYPDQKPQQ